MSYEKEVVKKFGKVISSGRELVDTKSKLSSISVGPALDVALNGGILEGSWTIISGNPKTGKSTTCLQICKNAQDSNRPIIYLDGESRLKKYNLLGVKGLDLDKIQIIHSPEDGNQLSAEDFLWIAEGLIKLPENKGALCVIDSCSSLVTRKELESDPSAEIRTSLPKLLSHWVKKNASLVTSNRIIVIIITHYITNTSGYGKTKIPDCGVMVQYQADTRLDIAKIEPWIEDGHKIGQAVHWKVDCSSMGASGTDAISYIRYGIGLDKTRELLELAETLGVIDKSGSWYSFDLKGERMKFQGKEKLQNFVGENPDAYDFINSSVWSIMT